MLRTATIAVLGLRVAYGAGADRRARAAHAPLARPAAGDAARARSPLRGLGAREIVVHGARDRRRAAATSRCARSSPPASAGDLADIAATVAGRRGLPDGAAPATLAVAGGSALLTAALAAAVDALSLAYDRTRQRAGCSSCCTRSAPTATCGRR